MDLAKRVEQLKEQRKMIQLYLNETDMDVKQLIQWRDKGRYGDGRNQCRSK
jgi:hypothetical protein